MRNATSVTYNGKTLFTSSVAISAYIDYLTGNVTIQSAEAADITLLTNRALGSAATLSFAASETEKAIPADPQVEAVIQAVKETNAIEAPSADQVLVTVRKYLALTQAQKAQIPQTTFDTLLALVNRTLRTDSTSGISLIDSNGTLPLDVQLVVNPIGTGASAYSAIQQAVSSGSTNLQLLQAFDIHLMQNG